MQSRNQLAHQPYRLVYDAERQLCVSVKSKLERARTGLAGDRLQFVAYQSEEGLGQDYRHGRPETAFLVRPSGEVLQGVEAFLPLLSTLRGGKLLLWILQWPFARQLAEHGYRIMARHRYRWFGKAKAVRQSPPL